MSDEKNKVAKNDITGDKLQSKSPNQKYRDNWDIIFGKKLNANKSSKIKDPQSESD